MKTESNIVEYRNPSIETTDNTSQVIREALDNGVKIFRRWGSRGRRVTVAYLFDAKDPLVVHYGATIFRPLSTADQYSIVAHNFTAIERLQNSPISIRLDGKVNGSELHRILRQAVATYGAYSRTVTTEYPRNTSQTVSAGKAKASLAKTRRHVNVNFDLPDNS